MKAHKIILLFIAMFSSIHANAQNGNPETEANERKILIAYYSTTNNTASIAEHIRSLAGGDTFRIETLDPYPSDYQSHTEVAMKEKEAKARPRLKTDIDNMESYDIIFVGFPIWWGDAPMVIATLLEAHNLKGKTVVPFCTHGGGGVGKAFDNIKKYAPDASYLEGYVTSGSRASRDKSNVEVWLKRIGIL